MIIWFLVILIIIGIAFAVSDYFYENSEFKKLTNFSLTQLLFHKKVRKIYLLNRYLHKSQGEYKILLNVKLSKLKHVVDAIFIHESGIYVIDLVNKDGWIYGREQDALWAQVLYKEKISKFYNPIINNRRATLEIRELIPNVESNLFYSFVVFTDNSMLKTIEINSQNVQVITLHDVKNVWHKEMKANLSKTEIEKIYQSLTSSEKFSKPEKKTIKNLATN